MLKQEKMVSIIIPIYNAEKYIESSIESALNQDYSNIEIVLIDDGSTDSSGKICENYKNKYSNIKVLHQKNSGVTSARLEGLKLAKGEYIEFLDADDTMDVGAVSSLIPFSNEAEVITGGCKRFDADGNITIRKDALEIGSYKDDEELEYLRQNVILKGNTWDEGILPYSVGKLIKRDLALKIMLLIPTNLKLDEDRTFIFLLSMNAKSIHITDKIIYNYLYRYDSAMHSVQKDYVSNYILFYHFIYDYLKEKRNNEKIIFNLQRYVGKIIVNAPKMMGFHWKTFPVRYYHPFSKSLKGKIIILGAGDVGKDYYREIKAEYGAENVLWTDRDWKMIKESIPEIISMDHALEQDYDVIVLAIKSEVRAEQMKEMLSKKGIKLDKVKWESPIILSEY